MRCTKARELIVLEASVDATDPERRRASAHLSECQECRRFAAEEPLPLASLRTSAPLRDADFAAIRARVLSRVAADERHALGRPLRWVLAATVVALLGIAALLSIHRTDDRKISTPAISETAAPPEPLNLSPAIAPVVEKRVPVETATTPERRTPATRFAAHTKKAGSAKPSIPKPQMRILIQTADPDVRIIWIANPTQFSETTFLKEESS